MYVSKDFKIKIPACKDLASRYFLLYCHGSFTSCFYRAVTVLLHYAFSVLSQPFYIVFFYFTFTIVFACFFPAFTVMIAFPFLRALTFTEIFLAAFVVFLMVTIFFFEEVTVTFPADGFHVLTVVDESVVSEVTSAQFSPLQDLRWYE